MEISFKNFDGNSKVINENLKTLFSELVNGNDSFSLSGTDLIELTNKVSADTNIDLSDKKFLMISIIEYAIKNCKPKEVCDV